MNNEQKIGGPRLLLIEDIPGDIRLMKEAVRERGLDIEMHVASDGEQAMSFLRQQPPFEHVLLPDIILLDLNMPGKDGREVLAEIKGDDNLKTIPVIVLTVSCSENDIELCYKLQANSFISKPVRLENFIAIVDSLHNFWFTTVSLPRSGKRG